MTTKALPSHKTGDSFSLACTYKESGAASSIAGMAIAAQLRTARNVLVAEMDVTVVDEPGGKFILTPADPDTSAWPTGSHKMDIEITASGVIRSSETFIVPVVGDVTK